MTAIAIVPDRPQGSPAYFRAIAGEEQSVGSTVGQALDALRERLVGPEQATLNIVQLMRPDDRFTAVRPQRLAGLPARCWAARNADMLLPPQEQAELDALVKAELRAVKERSAYLVRQLPT